MLLSELVDYGFDLGFNASKTEVTVWSMGHDGCWVVGFGISCVNGVVMGLW